MIKRCPACEASQRAAILSGCDVMLICNHVPCDESKDAEDQPCQVDTGENHDAHVVATAEEAIRTYGGKGPEKEPTK